MKTVWTKAAIKEVAGLPQAKQTAVAEAITAFAAAPFGQHSNAKPLAGRKNGVRLRVGEYRVILDRGTDVIQVLTVAHRKEVYR